MVKVPNKLVIFGAVAAAALAIPGLLGPLMFQEASAQATQRGIQQATGVAAINVGVQVNANVEDNEVAVCAVIAECDVRQ
jgi:hypothetical protein